MKVKSTVIIVVLTLLTLVTTVACAPGMAWAG